ncbi:hypothetical protein ACF0H5_000049 [Mactra antiquata]
MLSLKVLCLASGLFTLCAMTWFYRKRNAKKQLVKPRMKLYWFDNFRSKRCEWLLAELGVIQDIELISINPKCTNQEILSEYRLIHPHGTVPCLQIDNKQPIIESGAICQYLAHLYGNLGPELDAEAYYNWISYSTSTLDDIMEKLMIQWNYTDIKEQDTELINKMVLKFQSFCKYFSKVMDGRDYICGDRLTAADCVLGYNIWWAKQIKNGVLLNDFPVILKYYERLSRRSSFQRVFNND